MEGPHPAPGQHPAHSAFEPASQQAPPASFRRPGPAKQTASARFGGQTLSGQSGGRDRSGGLASGGSPPDRKRPAEDAQANEQLPSRPKASRPSLPGAWRSAAAAATGAWARAAAAATLPRLPASSRTAPTLAPSARPATSSAASPACAPMVSSAQGLRGLGSAVLRMQCCPSARQCRALLLLHVCAECPPYVARENLPAVCCNCCAGMHFRALNFLSCVYCSAPTQAAPVLQHRPSGSRQVNSFQTSGRSSGQGDCWKPCGDAACGSGGAGCVGQAGEPQSVIRYKSSGGGGSATLTIPLAAWRPGRGAAGATVTGLSGFS